MKVIEHSSRPPAQTIPAALAEVALIDGPTSAAVGDMGISWWLAKVATGEAPQPVIQQPRMTRWRLADVKAFWAEYAAKCAAQQAAKKPRANKASSASQAQQ